MRLRSGRRAPGEPDERLIEPRLLFVHIPKTAGISLVEALERWAGRDRTIRFPNGGTDYPAFRALTAGDLERLRLISGHLAWPDLALHRDLAGWSPITLLREPVARVLSDYTFVRGSRGHPWHEEVSRQSLDGFLDRLEAHPWNIDQQCRFIVKEPDPDAALAVLRERFLLAATLEHLDAFTSRLGTLLGTPIRLGHANRSPSRLDPGRLPPATLDRILAMNRHDLRLYAAARELGLAGTSAPTVSGAA